jgi:hypothetical protein
MGGNDESLLADCLSLHEAQQNSAVYTQQ